MLTFSLYRKARDERCCQSSPSYLVLIPAHELISHCEPLYVWQVSRIAVCQQQIVAQVSFL